MLLILRICEIMLLHGHVILEVAENIQKSMSRFVALNERISLTNNK